MDLEQLKIPKERVAVLIGKKGSTKKSLEEQTQTIISVDSKTGLVEIKSKKKGNDFQLLKSVSVVKAIGRGFSPEHAWHLLDDEFLLDVINLQEIDTEIAGFDQDIAEKQQEIAQREEAISEKEAAIDACLQNVEHLGQKHSH